MLELVNTLQTNIQTTTENYPTEQVIVDKEDPPAQLEPSHDLVFERPETSTTRPDGWVQFNRDARLEMSKHRKHIAGRRLANDLFRIHGV